MPHDDADLLMTPLEVARLLKVSPRTLESWRGKDRVAKRGPAYVLVEGRVRYHRSSVEQYITDRTVGAE